MAKDPLTRLAESFGTFVKGYQKNRADDQQRIKDLEQQVEEIKSQPGARVESDNSGSGDKK